MDTQGWVSFSGACRILWGRIFSTLSIPSSRGFLFFHGLDGILSINKKRGISVGQKEFYCISVSPEKTQKTAKEITVGLDNSFSCASPSRKPHLRYLRKWRFVSFAVTLHGFVPFKLGVGLPTGWCTNRCLPRTFLGCFFFWISPPPQVSLVSQGNYPQKR